MKLLFALPGFHRYDRGAEVALLAVASELARSGHDVTVIGTGEQRPSVPYRYRQIPAIARERFEGLPTCPPFRSETAWEDATFAFSLMRRVSLEAYDASVTCSFPFTHWSLRRKGSSGPAHFFVTQNGDWPAVHDAAEFRWFRCDGLVCTNPDYLLRNSDRWNCALIPNGVDLTRFSPGTAQRDKLDLPADKPVVLMVSALIESKRVLEGIHAVAQVDDAFLVVAGDGPLRDEVSGLAGQLMPGRFRRVSLSAADMPDLYRSADAFLHLSLLESFGNVFVEAWACGLPVVGHDSERLRWILGDRHHLCDTQDPAALDTALKGALQKGEPIERAGIERFSWEVIASQYASFFQETLHHRQTA